MNLGGTCRGQEQDEEDQQDPLLLIRKHMKKYRAITHPMEQKLKDYYPDNKLEAGQDSADKKQEDEKEQILDGDGDTFSVMTPSKVYSNGWALGLITFIFQMVLVTMILLG